jgi:hypothetical protein
MIEGLPVLAPDATRAAHTLSRCHKRLAVRRGKIESRNRRLHRRAGLGVEQLLLVSACAAYLAAMAVTVLSIAAGP